ncbi:zinc finger MYM-type protein 1 [Trichonephila clavipes]|nr:zinc finger MYM-type protein 1 [Trichonephila clavipes]
MFQILLWSPWKYRCGQRMVRMAVMACSQKQGSLRAQAQQIKTRTETLGHWRERKENARGTPIDADLREQILKLGPYQPEGNFRKDAKGRSFSSSYYSFISKAGQKIERKWLCYSTRLHVAYCQVRWLFADRTNMYFKEASSKGFIEAANQTAKSLERDVLNILNTLDINLSKCRGQGYDGAANMSGAYGGLQKLIKDKQPRANYVHCSTHNLNLVLHDACNNVPHSGASRLSSSINLKRRLVARPQFRVPSYRKDTIHLQTSKPSPGFEPKPYNTV